MRLEAVFRFDYGHVVPWLERRPYSLQAIAGPDALQLWTPICLSNEDFAVREAQSVPFSLCWYRSHLPEPAMQHSEVLLECTTRWWRDWSAECTHQGPWAEHEHRLGLKPVRRSAWTPIGERPGALGHHRYE